MQLNNLNVFAPGFLFLNLFVMVLVFSKCLSIYDFYSNGHITIRLAKCTMYVFFTCSLGICGTYINDCFHSNWKLAHFIWTESNKGFLRKKQKKAVLVFHDLFMLLDDFTQVQHHVDELDQICWITVIMNCKLSIKTDSKTVDFF